MRIAVIGTGISGNLCARLLCAEHDVHVFEAGDYVGGHSNTVTVDAFQRTLHVDTGFMVFNNRTYPNFIRLLDALQVESQPSDMSFSVRCDRTGLEYQGSSLNGLFAQRANLFRPSFHRMLRDIFRFNRKAPELLADDDDHLTLGEYLRANHYKGAFVSHYLVPMSAAIWSARPETILDFPARFLIAFLRNHGLLQITDRPQWRTIREGARSYVDALVRPFRDRIRLNTPVTSVWRHADHVVVKTASGATEVFDEIVFATHADQALEILGDASDDEKAILGALGYQENEAVLHTDASWLPARRRAWASWNYQIPADPANRVTVTYDVNRLQSLGASGPVCVTLNPSRPVAPDRVLRRFVYHHPAFGAGTVAAQARHARISGTRRTHFCGAYWGYGFHEDGVNSALAVARYFGRSLDSCTAVSTKEMSATDVCGT